MDRRGAISLVDVIIGFAVLIALIALAPTIYEFVDMGTSVADPLTSLVLSLVVPLLILAIIVSMGVSARRAG